MNRFSAALFALAIVTVAAMTGDVQADPLSDAVAAVPGEVSDMVTAGAWTREDNAGVYRILVTRSAGEPPTARFFVQWVQLADGQWTVTESIEINEIAALSADITHFNVEPDGDMLAIYLEILGRDDQASGTYVLFVEAPDTYSFRPASN